VFGVDQERDCLKKKKNSVRIISARVVFLIDGLEIAFIANSPAFVTHDKNKIDNIFLFPQTKFLEIFCN